MTFHLHASDLMSKFGFSDGDLLSDTLWDAESQADRHEVLIAIVRRYLLPLLPGVEVDEVVTSHNPIRAREPIPEHLIDVSVEVSPETVLAVAAELGR